MTTFPNLNEIPGMLKVRPQSIRAYDIRGEMIDAVLASGEKIKTITKFLFENKAVEYLHVHNAKQGCFNCKIIRVA